MKKILFSLFVVFSLFFVNTNVFATTSLETLTFTRDDYMELYMACVNKFSSAFCSNYRYRHVVYISGLDLDYYDVTNGNPPDDPVIKLYMSKDYVDWHSDGIWTTYDNRSVDKGYLSISDGMIITKNLITGNISVYDFPGGGSYTLGPMETYATNWLFLMADSDIEYKGQVLFDYDDNYDVSGSIQTGSGVVSNADKTIIERVWDTIKGIFNTLVEGFKNMIDGIISLPEKIGEFFSSFFTDITINADIFNEKLDILQSDVEKRFGFIYQTFDILVDILNRFFNINSGNHIINIPKINDPIYGNTLVEATSFDFDSVLSKNNISYLHVIYLSFVDVIILFALVRYGLKQFNRIFGGGKQ